MLLAAPTLISEAALQREASHISLESVWIKFLGTCSGSDEDPGRGGKVDRSQIELR